MCDVTTVATYVYVYVAKHYTATYVVNKKKKDQKYLIINCY